MRRAHAITRCVTCRQHLALCTCDTLREAAVRLAPLVRTRVVVVIQAKEMRRASNTGHLAPTLLPGAELRHWGDRARRDRLDDLDPARGAFLLYPDAGAPLVHRHLHDSTEGGPVTLVVPDGSWRQANRMAHRDPVLSRLPRLAVPPGGPPTWTLRSSDRAEGLCTLEAVGRALAELDHPDIRLEVERVLRAQTRATLRARGRAP